MEHHSDREIEEILADLQRMEKIPAASPSLPEQTGRRGSWKRELAVWLGSMAAALAVTFLIFGVVFRFVLVDGSSMEPTLSDGDHLMMLCVGCTPETGDVVILSDETGLGVPLIKRVIATGGQTVSVTEDGVSVDGEHLYEPYAVEQMREFGDYDYPFQVPEGKIFVMGDNRNHSTDSRSAKVGLVDESEVLGEAFFRLYPFHKFGPVE